MGMEGKVNWSPPGPGTWTLDRTHFPKPISGYEQVGRARIFEGQARGFARFGIGIGGLDAANVNGWHYGQRALLGPEEMAAREPVAQETIATRRWRKMGQAWYEQKRPSIKARVGALRDEDVGAMDDDALVDHLARLREARLQAQDHHFEHISLFAVVGELLIAARDEWGMPPGDIVPLLEGSSPTSAETRAALEAIARALDDEGVVAVRSLDDVRAAGPAARDALDVYLRDYGWTLIGGFDVDDVSLGEVPDAVVASINAVRGGEVVDDSVAARTADIRTRVPEADRSRFDELLEEARFVYGVRDDDVAPAMLGRGLVRRALLECADRLVERERLHRRENIFEAGPDEVASLLLIGDGPSAGELAERAALRHQQATLKPPPFLGPPPQPPDLSAAPPAVRKLTAGFLAYRQLMFQNRGEPMRGFGIGTATYRGTARVVRDAETALARVAPGEVLVTTMTTPAFNAVLLAAGALVAEEGGLLSHAAIIARELGIPAVIGAVGVMDAVTDGDEIEIDPREGTVRLVPH